jgi:hypothetical protein
MKTSEKRKMKLGYLSMIAFMLLIAACNRTAGEPIDPTPTSVVLPGTIGGRIWNDVCQNYGESLPEGCVQSAGQVAYLGNGVQEDGEAGIPSTRVSLGVGLCPSEGLTETVTGLDGTFQFRDLPPGDYCITVNDVSSAPGVWTRPQAGEPASMTRMTVTVKAGEMLMDLNFGRDYLDEAPPAPTATPEPVCTDQAEFVRDVTVPDGTRFDPGESFTKTWRVRNNGTCAWTTGYTIVHSGGDGLFGASVISLPEEVEPGETIDISLALKAPVENGSYGGYWKLRDGAGELFGVGESGDSPIWVAIEVGPEPEPDFPDWRGEYYANKDLSGTPALVKNDKQIDKTLGLRSPDDDYLPRDNFSIRWTRTLAFSSKTYRFTLDITDGGRLYIDDELVINEWFESERRWVTVDVALKKGEHEVRFEYFNGYGGAVAQLWYEAAGDLTFDGWKAKYWMNKTMDGDIALIRDETEINFDWGNGGPVPGGRGDKFSAQWERKVDFAPGLYTLEAFADDGIRVYLDGALVINEWHVSPGKELYTTEFELSGAHDVTVQYFENSGGAKVKFDWLLLEPENHAPEVVEDAFSITQDAVLDVAAPGVLANDIDLDGDELLASLVIGPSHGTLELNEDGSFLYSPDEGFQGDDNFGYVVSDGSAESEIGLVTITVLTAEGES